MTAQALTHTFSRRILRNPERK
jgi:AraC-like DNA-binding protein